MGTALLGFAGLATGVSLWEGAGRSVQGAADEAALAAAIVTPCSSSDTTCYVTAARAVAAQDGFVTGATVSGVPNNFTISVAVNSPPTQCGAGLGSGNIEVVISAPQPLLFSQLFLPPPVTVGGVRWRTGTSTRPACWRSMLPPATTIRSLSTPAPSLNMGNCSITDITPAGNTWDSVDFKEMGGIGQMTASAVIIARNGVCDNPGGTVAGDNVGNCNGDFHIVNSQTTENFSNNTPGYSPFVFTGQTVSNPYGPDPPDAFHLRHLPQRWQQPRHHHQYYAEPRYLLWHQRQCGTDGNRVACDGDDQQNVTTPPLTRVRQR